jgi:cyclic-di-GMP-binding protein
MEQEMNAQPLASAAPSSPLQFTDSNSCKRWIEQLTLTNVQLTQQVLTSQLAALGAATLPPLERLKILETLRESVHFVQAESAKRYSGKPLPLEAGESVVWNNVIALWQETGRNYQQCLKAYREGDLEIAPHAALLTMRCLRLLGSTLLDYYRIYRQPPGAVWRALHELYAFGESHGFARIRVQDTFTRRDADSSCAECYLQVLLAHLANPFALSVRQMAFVTRWLERWATLVGLGAQPLPTGPIPSLVVDLTGSAGVVFSAGLEPQPHLRHLDLEQLSKTLRQTINLLKQGQTPGQLGLGEDARQPGCENLLMLLYVQWCRAGTARGEERTHNDEPAQVCFGLAAAHLHVSGRAFRQPGELSSREKQDMDTYGYITRTEHEVGNQAEVLEPWQILNQSASGFMCIQREPDGKGRVGHNQMLAVRRAGGRSFHLGMVQWLRMEEGGELYCGVRLFPGTPQAISVRPSNFSPTGSGRYERALLLPEVPAPATPATLVLPAGWFQSGRFVEVFSDRKQVAKLLNLLEKGGDFDRGTIVVV